MALLKTIEEVEALVKALLAKYAPYIPEAQIRDLASKTLSVAPGGAGYQYDRTKLTAALDKLHLKAYQSSAAPGAVPPAMPTVALPEAPGVVHTSTLMGRSAEGEMLAGERALAQTAIDPELPPGQTPETYRPPRGTGVASPELLADDIITSTNQVAAEHTAMREFRGKFRGATPAGMAYPAKLNRRQVIPFFQRLATRLGPDSVRGAQASRIANELGVLFGNPEAILNLKDSDEAIRGILNTWTPVTKAERSIELAAYQELSVSQDVLFVDPKKRAIFKESSRHLDSLTRKAQAAAATAPLESEAAAMADDVVLGMPGASRVKGPPGYPNVSGARERVGRPSWEQRVPKYPLALRDTSPRISPAAARQAAETASQPGIVSRLLGWPAMKEGATLMGTPGQRWGGLKMFAGKSLGGGLITSLLASMLLGKVSEYTVGLPQERMALEGVVAPSPEEMLTEMRANEIRQRQAVNALRGNPEKAKLLQQQLGALDVTRTGQVPGEVSVGGGAESGPFQSPEELLGLLNT